MTTLFGFTNNQIRVIDQLKSMALFASVVEARSFRGAAASLSLSPSVVSQHVTSLEKHLGVALLYRSTRAVSLTQDGQRLYAVARAMLDTVRDGLGEFADQTHAPLVSLRVALPTTFSRNPLFKRVTAFAKTHPGVRLSLVFSDTTQGLIKEGFDAAIRMGSLSDSELKSRKIGDVWRIPVCTPAYRSSRAVPTQPQDLEDWDFISFSPVPDKLELHRAGRRLQRIWGRTRIVTDSVDAMRMLALDGLGVAAIPAHMIDEDVKAQRLVPVLPGWSEKLLSAYVVWPGNVGRNSLVRRFVDAMGT